MKTKIFAVLTLLAGSLFASSAFAQSTSGCSSTSCGTNADNISGVVAGNLILISLSNGDTINIEQAAALLGRGGSGGAAINIEALIKAIDAAIASLQAGGGATALPMVLALDSLKALAQKFL